MQAQFEELRASKVMMGPQTRAVDMRVESADLDARTVEVSFSSELPVERWWGMEILRHDKASIDMERADLGLPVLDEHGRQIGIGENVRLKGKRLWAKVRFGASEIATETLHDVANGIRKFTSVGYRNAILREIKARKMSNEPSVEGGDLVMGWDGPRPAGERSTKRWFEATRWIPMEFSFVSVPADHTVGARSDDQDLRTVSVEWLESRADDAGDQPAPDKGGHDMKRGREVAPLLDKDPGGGDGGGAGAVTVTREEVVKREAEAEQRGADAAAKRISEVTKIGEAHNPKLIKQALEENWDVARMHHEVLAAMPTPEAARQLAQEQESPLIGMTQKQVREYSLCDAILSHIEGRFSGSLEQEASDAVAKMTGRTAGGFFLPYEVMARSLRLEQHRGNRLQHRGDDADTTEGAGLVGTELHDEAFIDVLRARTQVVPMGATVMAGLRSTVTLPKQTANSTSGWVAESSGSGESAIKFGVVTLSPNTVRARQDISRRLLLQSTPMADAIIMRDLGLRLGIAIDKAAIDGPGTGNAPTGITITGSIGDVAIGTNGGAPTWGTIVELESDVAAANADVGTLGYLTSAIGRGKLKTVGRKEPGETASASFVWDNDQMNGYKAMASTNVPDDLEKGSLLTATAIIFGNWADCVIGLWGMLDIKPDPYSQGDADDLIIRAFQDADVQLRHPESFSACLDADMST